MDVGCPVLALQGWGRVGHDSHFDLLKNLCEDAPFRRLVTSYFLPHRVLFGCGSGVSLDGCLCRRIGCTLIICEQSMRFGHALFVDYFAEYFEYRVHFFDLDMNDASILAGNLSGGAAFICKTPSIIFDKLCGDQCAGMIELNIVIQL